MQVHTGVVFNVLECGWRMPIVEALLMNLPIGSADASVIGYYFSRKTFVGLKVWAGFCYGSWIT